MNIALRIATHLPLKELWRNDGFTSTKRPGRLGTDDIVGLLRLGRVQFVVADVGDALALDSTQRLLWLLEGGSENAFGRA